MNNTIKTKSIITLILLISSYTHIMPSFEGLSTRERKMSPAQVEQLEQRLTPLHFATTVEEATDILKYGPDINARDINNCTPVQHMLENGYLNAATYLIQQGAEINRTDRIKHINLLKQECIFKRRK